jgi:poly-gamma-glutamate synthesis protein (capsule biosynthesis protein)
MDSAAGMSLPGKQADRFVAPVEFSYIWGDALEFQREAPRAKVITLETTVTRSDIPWQEKDVHYKMSPDNIHCLTAAGIDCCVLANNHMLDWGIPGLLDTLEALDKAGINHAGPGVVSAGWRCYPESGRFQGDRV